MVITLALAMEAAGPNADIAAINAKMREVANPPGEEVFTFAAGKAALAAGRAINYQGASSVLDFDQFGDVTPDFGVFVISGGRLERRYIVSI
jgi:branched-chain amino acid transport system substrate-binding protein